MLRKLTELWNKNLNHYLMLGFKSEFCETRFFKKPGLLDFWKVEPHEA